MFKANIDDVIELFTDKSKCINIGGYDVNAEGKRIFSKKIVSKNDFSLMI
jgi:hypothetical protein